MAAQAVPFDDFLAALDDIQAEGPWRVERVVSATDLNAAAVIVNPDGEQWQLLVGIESPDQVVISLLFAGPVPEPPDVAFMAEATDRLAELGLLRFLAAEVVDGECLPIQSIAGEAQAPLGSVFKLYVLGAVVDAIERGEIGWDTPVVIRDELDSIPSGVTQDDPAGTDRTVVELAERMISISDNTATDHLIDLVGRDQVEAALSTYGHSQPARNKPFLTTREFTILKFGPAAERRVAYATEDEEARRILSINPGVPDTTGQWQHLWFQRWSEPGVLAAALFVVAADGRQFVVAGSVSNEEALVPEDEAIGLLAAARDLVLGES